MKLRSVSIPLLALAAVWLDGHAFADDPAAAAAELEKAIHLEPNLENGRKVYLLCAVCHQPEG